MVYVSYEAENLQFYLWLRDYTKRFFSLPESEQALSPEWTQRPAPTLRPDGLSPEPGQKACEATVDMTAFFDDKAEFGNEADASIVPLPPVRIKGHAANTVATANVEAGLRWESCTVFHSPSTRVLADHCVQSPFSHSAMK